MERQDVEFDEMMDKPSPQSYWVHDRLLCAGHYPGDLDPVTRDANGVAAADGRRFSKN